jgi:glucosamine--fructose-6-phosphate aminotransferase (isomerizing)
MTARGEAPGRGRGGDLFDAVGSGTVIALLSAGDDDASPAAHEAFSLPRTSELLPPLLAATPLPLSVHHLTVPRGCDADQAGSLARSVAIE